MSDTNNYTVQSSTIRRYPVTSDQATTTSASTTSQDSTDLKSEFAEILNMMMISSMMGGSTGDSSGMSSMLGPLLMYTMMEKLLSSSLLGSSSTSTDTTSSASNTSSSQTASTAKTALASTAAPDQTSEDSSDTSTPEGTPVDNVIITQYCNANHVAIDFGVSVGTELKATMDGTVTYAGWNDEGYGNLVVIQNGPYKVYYGHLSEIPVEVGQTVSKGDVIGLSGNTGNSTGPHLHYEVRYNDERIDPTSFTLE